MFTDTITYEDFNGETQTMDVYFNISKMEAFTMDPDGPDGYAKKLQDVADSNNMITIIDAFRDIVKKAYGVKSEDGKRFIKSEEAFREFEESPAYDEFMMKLVGDEGYVLDFIFGAFPYVDGVNKENIIKQMESGE